MSASSSRHANNDVIVRTSKYLSLILRHKPEIINLQLDRDGWADIDELISCAAKAGKRLDRNLIEQVVAGNDKKRFGLSEDGKKIRAVQGHSTEQVRMQMEEVEPPLQLYHGTATRFLPSILAKGLISGSRHHVHLSGDVDTAVKVGQRHGQPVVLRINTQGMLKSGLRFYRAENGVWLTDHVPAEFIERM